MFQPLDLPDFGLLPVSPPEPPELRLSHFESIADNLAIATTTNSSCQMTISVVHTQGSWAASLSATECGRSGQSSIISNNSSIRLKHPGVTNGSDVSDGTLYSLAENYRLPVA